ncbi:MAG: hypothetical protein ACRCV9_07555 [Burkholderiaceae bacterium]
MPLPHNLRNVNIVNTGELMENFESIGADLADPTSAANGAGAVALNFDLNYAANTTGWGNRVTARGLNVLRYVPVALWAAALAGTSTDDHTAHIQAAINAASNSMETEIFIPAGKWNYTRLYCYYDATLNPGFNINRNAEVWINGAGYSPENGGSCGTVLNCTSATGDGFTVSPASEDALPYRGRDFRATGISFQGATSGFLVVCRGVPSASFDGCEFVQSNSAGSFLHMTTAYFGGLRVCRFRNTASQPWSGTGIRFGTTIDGGIFVIDRCNMSGCSIALDCYTGTWQLMSIYDSELHGSTYDIRSSGGVIQQLNCNAMYFEGVSSSFISDSAPNLIRNLNLIGCWFLGAGLPGPAIDLQAPNSVQIIGGYAQDQNNTFLNIAALPSGGRGNYRVSGFSFPRTGLAPAALTLFTGVLPALDGVDYAVSDPNVTLYATTATSGFPAESRGLIGGAAQISAGGLGMSWVRNYSVGGGAVISQSGDGFPRAIVVTQTAGAFVDLAAAASGLPHGTFTFVKNANSSTGNLSVRRNGGAVLALLAPGACGWFLLDLRTTNDWV